MRFDRSTLPWLPWTLITAAFILLSCDQTPQPPPTADTGAVEQLTPSETLLLASAKVALPPEGTTLTDLPDPESRGAVAMQQYCATCHALPAPAMHSATDWPAVLRRMWLRMGEVDATYGLPVPELGDRIVMLDYVTANALKVNLSALPDGPDREYFEITCGQCHELPDPSQHSSEDWFVVVRRMNQHMQDLLDQALTSEQTERLVQYLAGTSM